MEFWQSEEPPERPVGLTPEASLGLAGFAARLQLAGMLAIHLCGVDCFLRRGELFTLNVGDVDFVGDGAVLKLDNTQTLQRSLSVNTLSEVVVVESQIAIHWLREACSGKADDDLVMGMSAATCQKTFQVDG